MLHLAAPHRVKPAATQTPSLGLFSGSGPGNAVPELGSLPWEILPGAYVPDNKGPGITKAHEPHNDSRRLVHIERRQLRLFVHLTRIPPR